MCVTRAIPHIHTADELSGLMESSQAFTFDRVFDPTEGQEPVFEEVARSIVDGTCVNMIHWYTHTRKNALLARPDPFLPFSYI